MNEYIVNIRFVDGSEYEVVVGAESKSEAIKTCFGNGKKYMIAPIADTKDKIGYSVDALCWVTVIEKV